MTIIFLSPFNNKIYVCPEGQTVKTFDRDDPALLDYVPNDSILYVKDGGVLNKAQFSDYLDGSFQIPNETPRQATDEFDSGFRFSPKSSQQLRMSPNEQFANAHRNYIHPKHNGTILITDISTKRFPDGVELNGKYDFLPIDEIGEAVLEESYQYKGLLAKGKIEIVNHEFYMRNRHKNKKKSPTDMALDAILVKDQRRGAARAVANSGGVDYYEETGTGYNNDVIEIYVD